MSFDDLGVFNQLATVVSTPYTAPRRAAWQQIHVSPKRTTRTARRGFPLKAAKVDRAAMRPDRVAPATSNGVQVVRAGRPIVVSSTAPSPARDFARRLVADAPPSLQARAIAAVEMVTARNAILLSDGSPRSLAAEDGSYSIEWDFDDRRFGVLIDVDESQSGWYLAVHPDLGAGRSGRLADLSGLEWALTTL